MKQQPAKPLSYSPLIIPEIKLNTTITFLAFHPKALNKHYSWQVFWLSCFSGCLPVPLKRRTVAEEIILRKNNTWLTGIQDYSYGDSSGFAPDSLLIQGLL
jgi:hypothetical protein